MLYSCYDCNGSFVYLMRRLYIADICAALGFNYEGVRAFVCRVLGASYRRPAYCAARRIKARCRTEGFTDLKIFKYLGTIRRLNRPVMQARVGDAKLAAIQRLGMQSTSVGQRHSPGLDLSHGFMKKIQRLQMEQRRQLALKNAASASAALRAAGSQRSTKPTLQIYRPPGARLAEMQRQQNEDFRASNTDDIHWRPTNGTTACNPVPHPKPRLDNCEEVQDSVPAPQASSAARDEPEPPAHSSQLNSRDGDDEDSVLTYDSLVKQAMQDPNTLNTEELQWLARGICQTASRSVEHAEMAASFCQRIASQMADSGAFIKGLLSVCNELFGNRAELMGPLEKAENMPMRWTPYVTFVAKLLQAFDASGAGDTIVNGDDEMLDGSGRSAARQLAFLLSSCFQTILRPPSLGSVAEMECLKSAMAATGKAVQRMEPHLMRMLMARMRDAFLEAGTSVRMRKILLELIDLHGSGWQLTPAQQMYYDPARSFQRRE